MTSDRRVDVRPINPEEMDQFAFVAQTALALHGPGEFQAAQMTAEWTTCVFEGDELATTFAAWPFSMRFNGARLKVAGVTMVGTLPHKRRRGYLRRAMLRSFDEQRERGQSVAILYASMAAIYQRFGYSVASTHFDYSIDPRDVRFVMEGEPGGEVTVREATPDDGQKGSALDRVYRAYADSRTLLLHRGMALWQSGPFAPGQPADGPNYVALYEEDGEPLGYVIYSNRSQGDQPPGERDQVLTVKDLAWLTPAAYVALWRHLGAHDLVRRLRFPSVPEDDPAFRLIEEPRRLRRRWRDGILLRVVDAEAALAGRPYGAPASLTFELSDPLCEWNRGVWRLETDGRASTMARSDASPDLHIPVHALAAMIGGYLPPSRLARMGRLEALRPETLALWDRVFATRQRPFCANGF